MYRTCVLILGTAALGVAGCGGDSKGSSSASVTKAQYIAKATSICRDTKKAQQPYSDQVDALPRNADIKKVGPILEGGLNESRKGLAKLRAIGTPSTDKATIDAYYATADKLVSAQTDLAKAASDGNRKEGQKIAARTDPLFNDERRLARKFGIKECDNIF